MDCMDEHGNTLLLLACQQGNKKMVKAIMRRGSNIHAQNNSGNSALHFCHEYGHQGLADWLLSKGADDSMLNIDGLTCYEGLNSNSVEAI